MSDKVLEPGLTKDDKRVLTAIPPPAGARTSIWLIAESLRLEPSDLQSLMLTVNGLHQLGYIDTLKPWTKNRVYWRTRKGDEAVA